MTRLTHRRAPEDTPNDKEGGNGRAETDAIVARNASKLFLDGAVMAFRALDLGGARQGNPLHRRPERLRQDHLPALHRRADRDHRRRAPVGGKPVTGPPQGVAMVFQHFGLLPWKTVYDNAAFGLAMAHAPAARIRERVGHYLDLVGLNGFERHYPYQLSGGMQQRVGLVRALAIDPDILLMDEPFAALDAQTREVLQEELLRIMQDERKTMVFITHSIDEAILLGDRIAVMSARPGRIKEVLDLPFGRPRDVNALRADPRFAELRAHIWNELRAPQAEAA